MMNKKRLLMVFLIVAMMITPIQGTTRVVQAGNVGTDTLTNSDSSASKKLTVADMPSNYKTSIEWVYNNRMLKEGTPKWRNLIFDQIYAGKGTLNYVVRWQSSKNVTLEQRQKIETMLNRQMNEWTKHLIGYDGWPFDEVKVKVVGWACANASQILNKQANEIVYSDCIVDDMSKTDSKIPSKLPCAPDSLSRFVHYRDTNYSYPGGLDKRFDMYLWATSSFEGGHGGDWGQRMSEDYILGCLDEEQSVIVEHEIGHGFGLPDFYQANERPPEGFPDKTIMWASNSMTITNWDIWLLRYTWSQIKSDTTRFPANVTKDSTNTTETAKNGTAETFDTTNINAALNNDTTQTNTNNALNTSETAEETVINPEGIVADADLGIGNEVSTSGTSMNQENQKTDSQVQNADSMIKPTADAKSCEAAIETKQKSSSKRLRFFRIFASFVKNACRR
jgi:hypothetical protein